VGSIVLDVVAMAAKETARWGHREGLDRVAHEIEGALSARRVDLLMEPGRRGAVRAWCGCGPPTPRARYGRSLEGAPSLSRSAERAPDCGTRPLMTRSRLQGGCLSRAASSPMQNPFRLIICAA
jgi:hypothetical protein